MAAGAAALLTRDHRQRSAAAAAAGGRPAWTAHLILRVMSPAATNTPVPRCQLQEIIPCPLDPPYRRLEPVLRCTGKLSLGHDVLLPSENSKITLPYGLK